MGDSDADLDNTLDLQLALDASCLNVKNISSEQSPRLTMESWGIPLLPPMRTPLEGTSVINCSKVITFESTNI